MGKKPRKKSKKLSKAQIKKLDELSNKEIFLSDERSQLLQEIGDHICSILSLAYEEGVVKKDQDKIRKMIQNLRSK